MQHCSISSTVSTVGKLVIVRIRCATSGACRKLSPSGPVLHSISFKADIWPTSELASPAVVTPVK